MSVIEEVIKKAKKDNGFALQLTAMVDMFTIMIVFLLKSYDTSALEVKNVDNLQLPASVTASIPEEALLMLVSQKAIFIGDKKVAEIVDGKVDPKFLSENDEDYIKPLFEELNAEAKKIEEITKRNPTVKFEGKVFMQADKELHYSVLRKVLYTATMAGYGDLRMAALDGSK
jgi:biopolymer transport protein ExbD